MSPETAKRSIGAAKKAGRAWGAIPAERRQAQPKERICATKTWRRKAKRECPAFVLLQPACVPGRKVPEPDAFSSPVLARFSWSCSAV